MRERFGRADGLWCAWQSELIKAVTSPGLLATVLGGLASAALLGALVRVGDDPAAWRTAVASWLVVAPVGAGALIAGEEYHSGQVATTLTATPQRVVALVAKTVVAAVVLAVLASGAVVLTVAADPASAPTWREAVAFLATLWWPGLLAYGLALALRGILPAVAVVLSTLWLLPRPRRGAPAARADPGSRQRRPLGRPERRGPADVADLDPRRARRGGAAVDVERRVSTWTGTRPFRDPGGR